MRAISRWSGNTNGRQVLLSVCIPTYNRAQYLEKAIRSIIAQADPRDVDIVIVDNHSTDETEAVIAQFAGENFDISYTKRELNVGADRNVIEVGDYSTGEYFWIFGSDDTMPPGSVEQVLRSIATYRPNLILGDAYDCDLQLNQTGYLKFLRCGERQFDFSERGDVYSFLERRP